MTEISPSSNAAPSVPAAPADPTQVAPTGDPAQQVQAAPGPVETQAPDSKDQEPKFSFDAIISDDDKNYLKSQGVEQLNADGLKKLIANHKELRSKKETTTNNSGVADALATAMGVQPTQAAQPAQPAPQAQAPQVQEQQPAQPTTTSALPSELEIFNFTNTLTTMYPKIKDNITSGQLFKDMGDMGIAPASSGKFNVQAVLKFAELQNKQYELQAQLDESNKPSASAVPDANLSVDSTQPISQTLDMNQAQNIVLWSNSQAKIGKPVHPQFEQAKEFLRTNR